jgi:hypothetical protein
MNKEREINLFVASRCLLAAAVASAGCDYSVLLRSDGSAVACGANTMRFSPHPPAMDDNRKTKDP